MRGLKVATALIASRFIHIIKTRRGMKLPALLIARNMRRTNRGQPAQSDRPRPAIQAQAVVAISDANAHPHQHPQGELNVHSWCEQCDALAKDAIKSSGLSHDWCVELYSSGVDRALEQLPKSSRDVALQVANEVFDYRSPAEREESRRKNAENAICLHGIPFDCCPLGCGEFPDECDDHNIAPYT